MTTPENSATIWVQSDLLPDGTYVTAIHYNDDQSRVLDRQTGMAYVAEIFTAAVHAEHDAAVLRQLTSIGVERATAGQAVVDLRADRPPLNDAATAPLRLAPGVSHRTGAGFLAVFIGDRQVGQWDPADARDHATNVLTVLTAADLDATYRRYLTSVIGIDTDRAQHIVGQLAAHIH